MRLLRGIGKKLESNKMTNVAYIIPSIVVLAVIGGVIVAYLEDRNYDR